MKKGQAVKSHRVNAIPFSLFFAVVIRGPVDPTKVLRWFESCHGEEDGTRCVKGGTEDLQMESQSCLIFVTDTKNSSF